MWKIICGFEYVEHSLRSDVSPCMKELIGMAMIFVFVLACKDTSGAAAKHSESAVSVDTAESMIDVADANLTEKNIPETKFEKEIEPPKRLPIEKQVKEKAPKSINLSDESKESISVRRKVKSVATKEPDVVEVAKNTSPLSSETGIDRDEKQTDSPKPAMHQTFNELLKKYVNSAGVVDYAGLTIERDKLTGYLEELEAVDPAGLKSRAEAMSFWINLYNAATLQLILDHYPMKSIIDLDGGKTWDVARVVVNGKMLSLNEIENDILRPRFQDARIHFAVNCAAKSCPPLANQAFTATNLESLLERRTRAFINDASQNNIEKSSINISKIFDWYKGDFTPNIIAFIQKYSTVPIDAEAEIHFGEYDWALNGR